MISYSYTPFDVSRAVIARNHISSNSSQFAQAQVIIPERSLEFWDQENGDIGIGLCGHFCRDPKPTGCCHCSKYWGACNICIEAMETRRERE